MPPKINCYSMITVLADILNESNIFVNVLEKDVLLIFINNLILVYGYFVNTLQ